MSRILILLGILLILIGVFWPFLEKLGLGHLPGDIIIKRDNFSIYFPIVTCIIISVLISVILWLINR